MDARCLANTMALAVITNFRQARGAACLINNTSKTSGGSATTTRYSNANAAARTTLTTNLATYHPANNHQDHPPRVPIAARRAMISSSPATPNLTRNHNPTTEVETSPRPTAKQKKAHKTRDPKTPNEIYWDGGGGRTRQGNAVPPWSRQQRVRGGEREKDRVLSATKGGDDDGTDGNCVPRQHRSSASPTTPTSGVSGWVLRI